MIFTKFARKLAPYMMCLFLGLFYAFEMLQLSLGSTLGPLLVNKVHMSIYQLNLFSSVYLYTCALAIIPAGIMLDRLPTKPLLLISLGICVLGTFIQATSITPYLLIIGRALAGFSSDFSFLGYFVIVKKYFKNKKSNLMKSLIYSFGAFGCILSQGPLTLLLKKYGLQNTLIFLFLISSVLFLILMAVLSSDLNNPNLKTKNVKPIMSTLKKVMKNKINLMCAFYASFANLPLMILGAFYGQLYLIKTLHFTSLEASFLNSVIFWGALLSPPLLSFFINRFNLRSLMVVFSLCNAAAWLYFSAVSSASLLIPIFFIFGILTNSQILSVIIVSRINNKNTLASSISILSIANNAGGAIYQFIFSWLLIQFRPSQCVGSNCLYSANSFMYLFIIIAIAYLLCAYMIYNIKLKKSVGLPLAQQSI